MSNELNDKIAEHFDIKHENENLSEIDIFENIIETNNKIICAKCGEIIIQIE